MSSGLRTNESEIKSACWTTNARSAMSFSVRAGRSSGVSGRLIPFFCFQRRVATPGSSNFNAKAIGRDLADSALKLAVVQKHTVAGCDRIENLREGAADDSGFEYRLIIVQLCGMPRNQ